MSLQKMFKKQIDERYTKLLAKMAPSANKRRKLEHSSDNEEDGDSFASFGSEEAAGNDAAEQARDGDLPGENEDEVNDLDGSTDDDEMVENEQDGDDEEAIEEVNGVGKEELSSAHSRPNSATTRDAGALRKGFGKEGAFTSGGFKSNMFKLQVDELLEQIRPRHGKREIAAEDALRRLKSTIEQIPARSPLPVEDAERHLLKKEKVATPFPNPRPPKDAKYKLEYQKPANVNVAGSHALKTAGRTTDVLEIDMVLTMPSAMFQEKDFLDYRYFYKRAYYLACVAAGLRDGHAEKCGIRLANFHDNPLQPIIVVEPREKDNKRWRINLLACVSADVFSSDKLQLEKNCIRSVGPRSSKDDQDETQKLTPFYNSTLRADMLVTPYLKLLHSASKNCEAFQDACLLGSTWLRQRRINSDMHAGGFGNFEWSVLVALMLFSGGPKGSPILSTGYSSYQLFKATLQVLGMKDLSKQPFVIGTSDYAPKALHDGAPILWDAGRSHNLLYKMAPWAYKHLRKEARTTLSMLGDQQYDGFDATFILRSDGLLYKYDCIVEVPWGDGEKKAKQDHLPFQQEDRLYKALQRGLGDRVSQINIIPTRSSSWSVDSRKPSNQTDQPLRIGLNVNPETVGRTVDHGPSAEQKNEAAAFRKFWGEKAELRRFKDGSILESLVWSAKEGGQSVLEQVIRYVLSKHLGESVEEGTTFFGDSVKRLMPPGTASATFQALAESYKQMEADIPGLEGLPLSIRQITPADAQLRSASLNAPMSGPRPVPANVVIQFEGSSRWPDDLVAIQRTKIAFLLKLSELLQDNVGNVTPRIGLENQEHETFNQAFLDLLYDSGAAFRMRIYHDREQTLLERQLKDKTLDPRSKEIAALSLAQHKRDYIKAPAHTQAIARLCSRHPALSGTIRLVKKWFASHLLVNHIADEVIELLVAKTFVQPWPWQTPFSMHTGFLRTLFFLSRWDWRAEPLIVDLSGSGDLKAAETQSITTKFEAWRNIDPALNRVVLFAASNVDHEGTTWTDGRPAKVIAGRMTALAKAACAEIREKDLALEPANLFSSPLGDFDFVLHLNPELIGKKKRKQSKANGAGFKNLEIELTSEISLAGYDPVHDFLQELEPLFGAAVLFFSGGQERSVIAGLWNPQTKERAWKLNLAYSTVPKLVTGGDDVRAEVNTEGMLEEIARLGGDMVERVEVTSR